MGNFFQSKLPIFRPRRSWHDLSHGNHLSSKMGKLVPFFCDRSEFGDKYKLSVIASGRTMPLWTPVMDQLKTKFAWYDVTIRSIWNYFEDFVTSAGKWTFEGDELPPEIPQFTMRGFWSELHTYLIDHPELGVVDPVPLNQIKGTLFDYLDYPYVKPQDEVEPIGTLSVMAFPLIAMGYIYNERFLNENIQAVLDLREIRELKGDLSTWSEAQKGSFFRWINYGWLFDVNWNKDYLTASQPYTQKGRDVVMPLNITIPDGVTLSQSDSLPSAVGRIMYLNENNEVCFGYGVVDNLGVNRWVNRQTGQVIPVTAMRTILGYDTNGNNDTQVSVQGGVVIRESPVSPFSVKPLTDQPTAFPSARATFNVRDSQGNPVEFSNGININDLRYYSSIQRVLEQSAIGGTRYVEYALHQYGIRISDKTAQRPRFMGGTSIPIKIGEVVQTSASETDSALGRYAGTGYQRGGAAPSTIYCEEPSIIIGLMWSKPQTSYMWGVPRFLAELDVFDFMKPEFANLGEQEVYNYEAMRNPQEPRGVFGYLMRYDHLRTRLSRVHGEMRVTLTEWHMARNNQQVALNSDFVKAQPTTRIFNVTDPNEDHLVHQLWINCEVKRSIPKHANPKLK